MSTFSNDAADKEYQTLLIQLRRLQGDIVYRSSEIQFIMADIVERQGLLCTHKEILTRARAKLKKLALQLQIEA